VDKGTAAPGGYTVTAAEFLVVAAEGADTLAALQGIGYGLLAVADQLAEAAAAKPLGVFGRLARWARRWFARKGDVAEILRDFALGILGPVTDTAVLEDAYARQAAALDGLRQQAGAVVLDAAETDLVRQALADAVASRGHRAAGCADCGPGRRCPDGARDDELVIAYGVLWATLPGGAS
jgi:hypothetical protein